MDSHVWHRGVTDPVARQALFDAEVERISAEGTDAHEAGVSVEANPYRDNPEPHFRNAWRGGWSEAALGIRLAVSVPGFDR